jgi:hypothetical protein
MYTAIAVRVFCFEKKFFNVEFDLLSSVVQQIATIRLVRIVKKLKYLIIVSDTEVILFSMIK